MLVGCVLNELCVFQVLFLLCAVKCIVRDLPCDWPSLLRCCVVVSPQKCQQRRKLARHSVEPARSASTIARLRYIALDVSVGFMARVAGL